MEARPCWHWCDPARAHGSVLSHSTGAPQIHYRNGKDLLILNKHK